MSEVRRRVALVHMGGCWDLADWVFVEEREQWLAITQGVRRWTLQFQKDVCRVVDAIGTAFAGGALEISRQVAQDCSPSCILTVLMGSWRIETSDQISTGYSNCTELGFPLRLLDPSH